MLTILVLACVSIIVMFLIRDDCFVGLALKTVVVNCPTGGVGYAI